MEKINLTVPPAELKQRRADWKAPKPRYTRGVLAKYAHTVSSASLDPVTDLDLQTCCNKATPLAAVRILSDMET